MMPSISMNVRKDGWVKGTVNGFEFTALVFGEPSEQGINEGRISKLIMTDGEERAVDYDRQWLQEPITRPAFIAYIKLIHALEALPVATGF